MFKKKKSPEQVKFEAVINDGFDAVCENRFIEWREAHKEEFEEALKHEPLDKFYEWSNPQEKMIARIACLINFVAGFLAGWLSQL